MDPENPLQTATHFSIEDWSRIAAAKSGSALFRTARPDEDNRRSLLFADPLQILSTNRLSEIPAIFVSVENALQAGYHVAGFLSYEAGYHFEPAAALSAGENQLIHSNLPLLWFGVYREPLVWDELENAPTDSQPDEVASAEELPQLSIGISRSEYAQSIHRIRRYIEAGDFYQANFTVKLRVPWTLGAEQLFAKVIENQPVPYAALINTGQAHIVSASPELFFCKQGRRIVVRPMKGTAHRGRDLEEDAQRAAWLANDEKNRAENVMIVDLLRNDLGRICATGSVEVANLFAVERYPDLLQMTSTIRGELKPGISYYEIFRSLFPCGSITGAPKIRTMQVIRELEQEPRGIACGAIGFISPSGDAILSVAIRTLTLRNQEVQMRVGSGITWDSDPDTEYDECLLKAKFLTRAPLRFELIETMLWAGEFFLLDLHLQRLESSARYFEFQFDLESVRAQLYRLAESFPAGARRRVRLLLSRSGAVSITSEPIVVNKTPATLFVASERTDSSDVFLRHKTTRRHVYDRVLAEARATGFDDALFCNQREEVTECAAHNVMIAKEGTLITPPRECGLLPGVYRRHLLATHPEVREAVITLDDLIRAERIFIFNSVRGLRRAHLVSGESR